MAGFAFNPITGKLDRVGTGGSGATGVDTLTGNSGTATSVLNNINVQTENSTPKFVGTAGNLLLDFALANLILGSSLPALTSGANNVGLGSGIFSTLTSGSSNIGIGTLALQNITTGSTNVILGYGSGRFLTTGSTNVLIGGGQAVTTGIGNIAIGSGALQSYTTGTANTGSNVALGFSSLSNISTGTFNTAFGQNSGSAYLTSESSNVSIANTGLVGESNTIRIGTQGTGSGQQNKAFMAGITGVTIASSAPTGVNSSGQISSLGFGTAGQLFTSSGAGVSPTYTTATYPSTVSQGDIIYGSAANTITSLAKNTTATRYLSNTGTNNNPAWAQIALATGVTGTLSIANGGTNAASMTTSNGIVKYDGTRLVTSTANIDVNNVYGNVAQPYTDSWLFNGLTNVTGDGTTYTPVFDQTPTNTGGYFNVATGTYTAGTAGMYLYTFTVTFISLTVNHTSASLIANIVGFGTVPQTIQCNPFVASVSGTYSMTMSSVARLAAAGTINFQCRVSGSTKTISLLGTVSGGSNSWISVIKIS